MKLALEMLNISFIYSTGKTELAAGSTVWYRCIAVGVGLTEASSRSEPVQAGE